MLNESDYTVLPEDYTQFDCTSKIIVVGNSSVGKSSITKKATRNIFENYYSATIGFEYFTFKVKVKNKDVRLQIWDTCGQETYRSLIHGFYRNSSLAILVYSIDDLKSFEDLGIWLNDIKTNSSPDIKIFLIGNKNDLKEEREVPTEKAKQFQEDNDIILFLESSAKTGYNVQKIFAEAANIILEEHLKLIKLQELSLSYRRETDNSSNYKNENNDNTSVSLSSRRKQTKCCGK
jgi:small GTP-binding protein